MAEAAIQFHAEREGDKDDPLDKAERGAARHAGYGRPGELLEVFPPAPADRPTQAALPSMPTSPGWEARRAAGPCSPRSTPPNAQDDSGCSPAPTTTGRSTWYPSAAPPRPAAVPWTPVSSGLTPRRCHQDDYPSRPVRPWLHLGFASASDRPRGAAILAIVLVGLVVGIMVYPRTREWLVSTPPVHARERLTADDT